MVFRVKTNGVFAFLEYLFFVLEIFTFLYYANEERDDVINGSTNYFVAMATPLAPVSFSEKQTKTRLRVLL